MGPGGAFGNRTAGGDAWRTWQPLDVPGFVLDINPAYNVSLNGSDVSQITNRAPSASDAFVQANGSLQPAFESQGWGGTWKRPSMLFDGVGDYLVCTTGLPATLAGGTDTAFTLFLVCANLTLTSIRVLLGFFRTTNVNPVWDLFTSSSLYRSLKRDDAGGTGGGTITGGVPDTAKHVLEMTQAGTALTLRVDGTVAINAAAQDVGAVTYDAMSLGCAYANGSPTDLANMRFGRLLGFTGALGSTDAALVRSNLIAAYL